ncbi:helix-turn-helix domain-containing protein [Sulfitobacter sp.]|uniref:helix-turn-helix transcriptional regulator n=1 Tax=Sulfitobacter sp. TaxID=1903071 RepID=UPI0032979348
MVVSPTSNHTGVDPLLKVAEAAELFSISVPSFWRRVADGSIGKPIKIGGLSRWPRSEILAVIEKAKAQRDQINLSGRSKPTLRTDQ